MPISRLSIGMAMKSAREAAGMTLADISSRCGISISALSRSENGQRDIDFAEAVEFSRAVAIELDQLIDLAETFENAGVLDKLSAKENLQTELNSLRQLAIRTAIGVRAKNHLPRR